MEGRQHPYGAGTRDGALAGRHPQGAERTERHMGRCEVTPADGTQKDGQPPAFTRPDVDGLDRILRTGGRLPAVPQGSPQPPVTVVANGQRGLRRVTERDVLRFSAQQLDVPGGPRKQQVRA